MKGKIIIESERPGAIQEVGFRAKVIPLLFQYEIQGMPRNLPDGKTVEIPVEGKKESIDQFIKHIKKEFEEVKDISFGEVKGKVLEIDAGQSFMIEQLSKGISAQIETSKNVENIHSDFQDLSAKYGAIKDLMGNLHQDFKDLNSNLSKVVEQALKK